MKNFINFFEHPSQVSLDKKIPSLQASFSDWLLSDPLEAIAFYRNEKVSVWQIQNTSHRALLSLPLVNHYEAQINTLFRGQPPLGLLRLCKNYYTNKEWMAAFINWLSKPENAVSLERIIDSGILQQISGALGKEDTLFFYEILSLLEHTKCIEGKAEEVAFSPTHSYSVHTLTGTLFQSARPVLHTRLPVFSINADHNPREFYQWFGDIYLIETLYLMHNSNPKGMDASLKKFFNEDDTDFSCRATLKFLKNIASINSQDKYIADILLILMRLLTPERLAFIAEQPDSWPIFYLAPFKKELLKKWDAIKHQASLRTTSEVESPVLERICFLKMVLEWRIWSPNELVITLWFEIYVELLLNGGYYKMAEWEQSLQRIVSISRHFRPNLVIIINKLSTYLTISIDNELTSSDLSRGISKSSYNRIENLWRDYTNQFEFLLRLSTMTVFDGYSQDKHIRVLTFPDKPRFHVLIIKALLKKNPNYTFEIPSLLRSFNLSTYHKSPWGSDAPSVREAQSLRETQSTLLEWLAFTRDERDAKRIIAALETSPVKLDEWKTEELLERAITYDNDVLVSRYLTFQIHRSDRIKAVRAEAVNVLQLILNSASQSEIDNAFSQASTEGSLKICASLLEREKPFNVSQDAIDQGFKIIVLKCDSVDTDLFLLFEKRPPSTVAMKYIANKLFYSKNTAYLMMLIKLKTIFQPHLVDSALKVAASEGRNDFLQLIAEQRSQTLPSTQAVIDAALEAAVRKNKILCLTQKSSMKTTQHQSFSRFQEEFIERAKQEGPESNRLRQLITVDSFSQLSQQALLKSLVEGTCYAVLAIMEIPAGQGVTYETLIQAAPQMNDPMSVCVLLASISYEMQYKLQPLFLKRFPNEKFIEELFIYREICSDQSTPLLQAKQLLEVVTGEVTFKRNTFFETDTKMARLINPIIAAINSGVIKTIEQLLDACQQQEEMDFLKSKKLLLNTPISRAFFFIICSYLKTHFINEQAIHMTC